jgi:hypothetical protein
MASVALVAPPLEASPAKVPEGGNYRPRIVISTDIPPLDVIPGGLGYGPPEKRSDPDDLQSLVRFLVYSDDFRVEALIASSGTLANVANKKNLLDMIEQYAKVEGELRLNDPAYPTSDYLRQRTYQGLSQSWGKPAEQIIGDGKDTEASDAIIRLVDGSSEPTWFAFWGGSRELAQAIWRVKKDRPADALGTFLSKIRVYLIAHQDGTAKWLEDNFPDLFIITSDRSYLGMAYGGDPSLSSGDWVEKNVRSGHGPLGQAYPALTWSGKPGMQEGDTPSFLYLLSAIKGLNDPGDPTQGSWGGRFVPTAAGSRHFVDAPEGGDAISRWRPAFQNDFAARMQRTVSGPASINHAPTVVVEGQAGNAILVRNVTAGEQIGFSAQGTVDPDGDNLTYRWMVYPADGVSDQAIRLIGADTQHVQVSVQPEMKGKAFSLVLEVHDSGTPQLTSYRRVVVNVKP